MLNVAILINTYNGKVQRSSIAGQIVRGVNFETSWSWSDANTSLTRVQKYLASHLS